jgi:predicted RNA-binding protein YlxR (DUF448 family)
MEEPDSIESGPAKVTCAGCRQEGSRLDLERFVYHDEVGLMFDMRGGAPGREAWVHPLPGCVRAACWAGFSRALDEPLEDLDDDELLEDLEEGLHRRLRETMKDAARQGEVAVGTSAVAEGAASGTFELIVVDPDGDADAEIAASFDDGDDVLEFDEMRPGTLRDAFGREVGAVGVPPGDRATELGRTAEKLICLRADDSAFR